MTSNKFCTLQANANTDIRLTLVTQNQTTALIFQRGLQTIWRARLRSRQLRFTNILRNRLISIHHQGTLRASRSQGATRCETETRQYGQSKAAVDAS